MPAILFFEEDISYKLKNKTAVRGWLKNTIIAEGSRLREVNYIFCSDSYLLQINQQYLDHDTFTDIITFDNSEEEGLIIGDIFISIDRIRENAKKYGVTEATELHRVMVHGVLHLLGYEDKTAESKKLMTEKENEYLAQKVF